MHSVLIAAGGTGGHVMPGLCVASALGKRGVKVQWVGSDAGIEATLVPAAGIPLHTVPAKALRGKGVFSRMLSLLWLMFSLLSSMRVLFQTRPSLVLGMGGYVSGPCGLAAWLLKIPLVIHEQNSVPGMTNRFLAKIADTIFVGYDGVFSDNRKTVYSGNPIRQSMFDGSPPKQRLSTRDGAIRVLIMGGSQGAQAINRIVPNAMGAIAKVQERQGFDIVHQAGKHSADEVSDAYKQVGIEAKVFPFIENVVEYYQWADLVIARSGALTVSEIAAVGVASLLIPYPYAVDDHQSINAALLVKKGAAILMKEDTLGAENMASVLLELDRKKLLDMAVFAHESACLDATERVVTRCMQLIEGTA